VHKRGFVIGSQMRCIADKDSHYILTLFYFLVAKISNDIYSTSHSVIGRCCYSTFGRR